MQIPTSFSQVTKFSKIVALVLFMSLPFFGFVFGARYERILYLTKLNQLSSEVDALKIKDLQRTRAIETPYLNDAMAGYNFDFTNCQIKATLQSGKVIVAAGLNETGNKDTRCIQGGKGTLSDFGKYLAYEDVSGGVDLMLNVYSLEKNEVNTLEVVGPSSNLVDMLFLKDDALAALWSFYENDGKLTYYLNVYDIAGLHKNYEQNLIPNLNYFDIGFSSPTSPYIKELPLTEFGESYTGLSISTQSLIAHTKNNSVVFTEDQYGFKK